MIGNYLLEGLYFYNGFAFFDTLVDMGKMKATSRMINYIRRDELTHVTLFANVFREIQTEFPDMRDEELIKEMFKVAVEQEVKWSVHILGSKIMGLNPQTTEQYTKWLANTRLSQIGIEPLYPEVTESPYQHLERIQENNMEK